MDNGPFPAGHFNNRCIFRKDLRHALQGGGFVVADKGYIGVLEAYTLQDAIDEEHKMKMPIWHACHETINGCFKTFYMLKQIYCHAWEKQYLIFVLLLW